MSTLKKKKKKKDQQVINQHGSTLQPDYFYFKYSEANATCPLVPALSINHLTNVSMPRETCSCRYKRNKRLNYSYIVGLYKKTDLTNYEVDCSVNPLIWISFIFLLQINDMEILLQVSSENAKRVECRCCIVDSHFLRNRHNNMY